MSAECERYQDLMCARLDGELSVEAADQLRTHLRTCGDCRRMYAALGLMSRELSGDLITPPARLSDAVMERIYAEEETARPETEISDIRRSARSRNSRRRWVPLAAAACLVIIAGGTYLSINLLPTKSASGAAVQESVTLEAPAMEEAPSAAEAPAAGAVLSPAAAEEMAETETDSADLFPAEEAAEAPMADMAEANGEAALNAVFDGGADAAAMARPVYTVDDPAAVPEGREADFEALLRAESRNGTPSDGELHALAAVEYRGVIYEFLTDDSETVLLWRDAAESAYPVACAGTPAELWDILG